MTCVASHDSRTELRSEELSHLPRIGPQSYQNGMFPTVAKRWCKSHPDWLTAFGSSIPSIPSEVEATSPGSPSSHVGIEPGMRGLVFMGLEVWILRGTHAGARGGSRADPNPPNTKTGAPRGGRGRKRM